MMDVLQSFSLPLEGIGRKLESQTRKAVHTFGLLDGLTKVAVALSGGKDSVSMLLLLHALRGRGLPYFDIVCIHVSGAQTCGAMVSDSFLQQICQKVGASLISVPFPETEVPLECYPCSRIRRRLLFDMAKEAQCTTIAFGHHRDDNAQTVLMNMFHKAEFTGLLPKISLVKYGIDIIRPLIFIAEQDIKTFAHHHGFLRRTCQCPFGQNSKRKQVDQLLSSIETLFPHARTNIANAVLQYGSDKANLSKADAPDQSSPAI